MFGVSVADSGGPIALGDGSSGEAFTGRATNKEAGLASALLQVTGGGGVIANILAPPFKSHSSYYAFIFGLSLDS